MDWRACNQKRLVKNISIDKSLIEDLIKSSADKEYTASLIPLDDRSSASAITLYYDALRELLEALAIRKGYKIYNHECY